MNEYETKLIKNIEKHGCNVTHVMEDNDGPSFTYSTGIQQCTKQPEVILTGLNKDISHWDKKAKKGYKRLVPKLYIDE